MSSSKIWCGVVSPVTLYIEEVVNCFNACETAGFDVSTVGREWVPWLRVLIIDDVFVGDCFAEEVAFKDSIRCLEVISYD